VTSADFGSDFRALVVDDVRSEIVPLLDLLERHGFDASVTGSSPELLDGALPTGTDLVFVEAKLEHISGLTLAQKLADAGGPAVVLMGDREKTEAPGDELQPHLVDFLLKPFVDERMLSQRLRRIVQRMTLQRRVAGLVDELRGRNDHLEQLGDELREKNRQLEELVVRDPVTRLFNHAYYQDRLETEITRAKRYRHPLSILSIDIDHFTKLNDRLGHGDGERIIASIAEMLTDTPGHEGSIRSTDIAARYGGDEFGVILPETDKQAAVMLAERLRVRIGDAGDDDDDDTLPFFTASLGVAGYPEDGESRPALVTAVDTALVAAKRQGRNRVMPFAPGMAPAEAGKPSEEEVRRARLAAAVEESIRKLAFRIVFQPIFDSTSRKLFGYEALCRPEHPDLDGPEQMFAVASGLGRVLELGRATRSVLARSLSDLPDEALLFVNVHPQEVLNRHLLTDEPLLSHASRIVLEVTETAAIHDYSAARAALQRHREEGFRIALDDLGSGYASLNSLTGLEPEFVKLDMELLRGITSDSRTSRLIRHIIEYADGEDITTVAEGIETPEEAETVIGLGCPLVQGYFFANPSDRFDTDGWSE